jgi:hypothetical protein
MQLLDDRNWKLDKLGLWMATKIQIRSATLKQE